MIILGFCLRCWNTGERNTYHGPFWGGWPEQCECALARIETDRPRRVTGSVRSMRAGIAPKSTSQDR